MAMIRKVLCLLAHRTTTTGRCYGRTAPGAGGADRPGPRRGVTVGASQSGPMSGGLSPGAHERTPTQMDPARPGALLDRGDSPGPPGVDAGPERSAGRARAAVPRVKATPRGLLSARPRSAVRVLRRGVSALYRADHRRGPAALCRAPGAGAGPVRRGDCPDRWLAAGRHRPPLEAPVGRAGGNPAGVPVGDVRPGPRAVSGSVLLCGCRGQ